MIMLANRNLRLAVPVMLTAWAAAWLASRPVAQVAAPHADAGAPLTADAAAQPTRPKIQQPPARSGPVVDIFAPKNWEPPPPPAPAGVDAPSRPQGPPPLPFRFLGRIAEPGQPVAFLLLEGERIHHVRIGDTIGGTYRLTKADEGRLFFRYKPTNATQVLAIRNAS